MTQRSYCGAHTAGPLFEDGLRAEMWACLAIQRLVDVTDVPIVASRNLPRAWPPLCSHQRRAGCEDHPASVNLGVIVKATRKRTASRRSGT
jgi:hypothetical protein